MLTICIERHDTGCYQWVVQCSGAGVLVDSNENCPKNIEECLTEAGKAIAVADSPLVVISYRGVVVGSVVTPRLLNDTAAVTKWILQCYASVAHALG